MPKARTLTHGRKAATTSRRPPAARSSVLVGNRLGPAGAGGVVSSLVVMSLRPGRRGAPSDVSWRSGASAATRREKAGQGRPDCGRRTGRTGRGDTHVRVRLAPRGRVPFVLRGPTLGPPPR